MLLATCVLVGARAALAGPPEWPRRLNTTLSDLPHARTQVGACVIDLRDGREVFALNADSSLTPASTMKIFTMTAALTELGPDFEFRTILATDGRNLIVVGDGDPAIGDARLARRRDEPITAAFDRWTAAIRAQGISAIEGDLIIDDTVFDDVRIHPTWEAEDLGKWYAAPVGGLNLNDNCVDITVRPAEKVGAPVSVTVRPPNSLVNIVNRCRTGSGTPILHHPPQTFDYRITGRCDRRWPFGSTAFPDPGLLFADSLRTELARNGTPISGGLRRGRVRRPDGTLPPELRIIAVERTPISDVLRRAGKNSQNLFAECLLKRTGLAWAKRHGHSEPQGSFELGGRAVLDLLSRAHVDRAGFSVADGSGLSRANGCSARHLARVLAWVQGQSWGRMMHDSLSVAGADGSLAKRLKDTPDRVFGKTGTMRGIRALAGYVDGQAGPRYAFAVVFNGYKGPSTPYKAIQDRVCRILAEAADNAQAER